MTRKPRPSREYSWRAIPRYAPHNGLKLGYRVGDAATEKYGNDYEPSQHPNNTYGAFRKGASRTLLRHTVFKRYPFSGG